jgi:hypothetical protein
MSENNIDFSELIKKMDAAPRYGRNGPNRLTILGGQFKPERRTAFLAAWQGRWEAMPWRIWEHISEIGFADGPKDLDLLQRGEVFGGGGHLSLRRDRNRWYWRYIGPADQPMPEGFEEAPECEDFWTADPNKDVVLRCYEERVLLWGEQVLDANKQPTGHWWEDRVAAARLDYPTQLKGRDRVHLVFWRFTEAGRTVFVWYRDLV